MRLILLTLLRSLILCPFMGSSSSPQLLTIFRHSQRISSFTTMFVISFCMEMTLNSMISSSRAFTELQTVISTYLLDTASCASQSPSNQLCLFWFHIPFSSLSNLFVPCAAISAERHFPPSYIIKAPINFNTSFCLIIYIKAILIIFTDWRLLKAFHLMPLSILSTSWTQNFCLFPYFIFHSLRDDSQALEHDIQDLLWLGLSPASSPSASIL